MLGSKDHEGKNQNLEKIEVQIVGVIIAAGTKSNCPLHCYHHFVTLLLLLLL